MAIELRKAERKMAKLRIGVSAPSGGGKTYASLLIAKGLVGNWEKIALIDTENGSGELYSHLGGYNVVTLKAPFTPEVYIEAIKECEKQGMEAIIIDSATHEWDGKGGCLEIMESLGGRYQDWAKVTPRHRKFTDAILESPAHVITSTRRKQDYAMDKEQSGKMTVTKVGMKEVQREGFEYELTLAFDIDIRHNAKASKDRTGLFMDKPEFIITEETGKTLRDWANSGKDEKPGKIDEILRLLDQLEKPATEKTMAFMESKSVKELDTYVVVYKKELAELEKRREEEKKPANAVQKKSVRMALIDNGLREDWFEKEFGMTIDSMTEKQTKEATHWISVWIELKMKKDLEATESTVETPAAPTE